MLKNKTWVIAALFVALAMIFGCTDAGLLDDGSQPKQAEDLVIEGEDIVLEKAGTNSAAVTIDGTKVTFDGASMTSTGFYYEFPAAAAEYGEVVVYFKIISIDRGRPGLLVKNSNLSNYTGVLNDQDPQYQLNDEDLNFTVGMEFDTGKKKTSAFTGGRIAFQHQAWNPDGNGDAKYTVEVLKIVFPGDGAPPEPPTPPPSYTGAAGKVTLDKKATGRVDDEVVDADPSITTDSGTTVSATGVATLTEGSVLYYKFPTSAIEGTGANAKTVDIDIEKDFDVIEFTFTITNVDKTSGGSGNFKVSVYNYDNDAEYGINPGGSYQQYADFGATGTNPVVFAGLETWGAFGSEGVAIRYNYGDRASSGADKMDVKLAKVTFKAKQRYKVTFFVDSNPGVTYDIISGNTFNKSAIPASVRAPTKVGYKFAGWYDSNDWANTTTPPAVKTSITDDTALYAKWTVDIPVTKPELDAVQVTAAATGTLFDAKGDYASGTTAYSYTPPGGTTSLGDYWIVSDARTGQFPDWSVGAVAPFNAGDGATLREAIKTEHISNGTLGGYTRIGIVFSTTTWTAVTAGTESTSVDNPRFAPKWYDKVEITYDLVHIAGNTGVLVRNGPNGAGGDGTVVSPSLEAGTGKTITVNMSALNDGVSFVKNGGGAFLLRITKVRLYQE